MPSAKRKRSPSPARSSSSIDTIIGPRSPNTLAQTTVAGLALSEPLPSTRFFPHARIPSPEPESSGSGSGDGEGGGSESDAISDDDESIDLGGADEGSKDDSGDDDDDDETAKGDPDYQETQTNRIYRLRLGSLKQLMIKFLSEGKSKAAAYAFRVLLETEVEGKGVDLRREGFWEIGAEILLRWDGPGEDRGEDEGEVHVWENMAELYGWLVNQHPWSAKHLDSINAVDFAPGLFGARFQTVYWEMRRGLEKVDEAERNGFFRSEEDEYDQVDMMDLDFGPEAVYRRVEKEKERVRTVALGKMRVLEDKMDECLLSKPYSTNPELLRLLGMVMLYIADLCWPVGKEPGDDLDEDERDEAKRRIERRIVAREKAKKAFRHFQENGGEVAENGILEMLDEDE